MITETPPSPCYNTAKPTLFLKHSGGRMTGRITPFYTSAAESAFMSCEGCFFFLSFSVGDRLLDEWNGLQKGEASVWINLD